MSGVRNLCPPLPKRVEMHPMLVGVHSDGRRGQERSTTLESNPYVIQKLSDFRD